MGTVARFIVDRRPSRAADGSWVVLCTESEDQVEHATLCTTADDGKEAWPALSVRPMSDETHGSDWLFLRQAGQTAECDDGTETASLVESIAESASVLDSMSDVVSLTDWEEDTPDEVEGPKLPAGDDLPGSTRAWQGGAAVTRSAISFAQGAPVTFTQARWHRQHATSTPPAQLAAVPEWTEEAERRFDEDSEATLPLAAGVKDASHRARGSQGQSVKAQEKRAASIEKRDAARRATACH